MRYILNFKLLFVWLNSVISLFFIEDQMARSVLKPVTEVGHQVEKITDYNLSERLNIENANDEIGELAVTFNNTLDRLDKSFESQKMFLSNVSHELRTTMSALIAALELSLHKERSNEDYQIVVDRDLKAAVNQEKLLHGYLVFSITCASKD